MLALRFDLAGNHGLLGRVVDGLVQHGPGLVDVVDAGGAEGLKEGEDLLAVLEALGRVDERNLAPVGAVRVQQGVAGGAMIDRRDLVGEVVGVGETRVEAEAARGRERVGGIGDAGEKRK